MQVVNRVLLKSKPGKRIRYQGPRTTRTMGKLKLTIESKNILIIFHEVTISLFINLKDFERISFFLFKKSTNCLCFKLCRTSIFFLFVLFCFGRTGAKVGPSYILG